MVDFVPLTPSHFCNKFVKCEDHPNKKEKQKMLCTKWHRYLLQHISEISMHRKLEYMDFALVSIFMFLFTIYSIAQRFLTKLGPIFTDSFFCSTQEVKRFVGYEVQG